MTDKERIANHEASAVSSCSSRDPTRRSIYFIRHGESIKNVDGTIGGAGTPLTQQGVADMVRVAAWLREKALIDCNRCSFLMSSSIQVQESCAVIELELGVAFRVDSRLRHIGLGVLDGLTQKEAQDQYPKMWDALRLWSQGTANIGHVRIPGQEDVSDFYARIYAFWEDVLLRTEHDTVVVGTRSVGIAIANIAELGSRVFESDKYLRYALDPASISRFQVSPGASSVVYTNDTSFLAHRPALPDLR